MLGSEPTLTRTWCSALQRPQKQILTMPTIASKLARHDRVVWSKTPKIVKFEIQECLTMPK
jgi:hypothetical protein